MIYFNLLHMGIKTGYISVSIKQLLDNLCVLDWVSRDIEQGIFWLCMFNFVPGLSNGSATSAFTEFRDTAVFQAFD